MKKFSLLFFALMMCVGSIVAQKTITGSVIDNTGEPLIGASILAKGTTSGTITDIDGTYSLDVPDASNTLVISFTGYETQEFDITNATVVDVVLEEGQLLDEVVVTGLGIKKDKKALGYGVSTINTKQIENRPESDVSRVLRGKTTGVDITSTSGLAGSGTSIIIRGYSSISGNNQPLFVVDGVPLNTATNATNGFVNGGGAASSRFLDLDPNNIAEISILKGLSATVLYGEQGRNGVVLVTTKTGDIDLDRDKGFEVSVSQGVSSTSVANLPDYQNTYGNGFSGSFGWFFSNWGPAFDNTDPNFYGSAFQGVSADGFVQLTHPYLTGQNFAEQHPSQTFDTYEYRPFESAENFFESGISTNTNINISKNLGNGGQFKASYSYLDEEGFTPDLANGESSNTYEKHNLSLGAGTKLANGLKINGVFSFVASNRLAPPASPGFGSGTFGANAVSIFSDVLYTPRSIDIFGLPFQSELDGSQTYYRQTSQITHPLWSLNNTRNNEDILRFTGTANLGYEITDNIEIKTRVSADQYFQDNTNLVNRGGAQLPDGSFTTVAFTSRVTDILSTINFDFDLTESINLSGFVGGNARRDAQSFDGSASTQQFVFNLAGHNNFIENNSFSNNSVENQLGLLGAVTFGYNSYLYVQLQARNDWTSTLEGPNQSVFYPSANVSFILSDAIPSLTDGGILNYLKVRAGIGTSAGYPDPFQTRTILGTNTRSFQSAGGTIANTNFVSNQLGNSDLRHETHREVELGIEAKFFQNRFGIDLSLYDKNSSDLIIALDTDPAIGFTSTTINAAEVTNRGVELGLNFTPIAKAVQWDLGLNFTANENTVESIAEGVDQVLIDGFANANGGNWALPGEPFSAIQGSTFERVGGQPLVNGQGFFVESSDISVIGDPNPDYTVSYLSTLSYKGVSLFINWNYVKGGDILSISAAQNLARGNTVDTDFDRFLPFILPGNLADGSPNNIQIFAGDAFFEGFFGPTEGQIFDGTHLRLREVALSYEFPRSFLENSPIGSASISLTGENLWFNALNFPEGINFDPEVLSLGVGNGRGIDFVTGPTAERIGVTLSLTF
jgi:TonB-linked SusC/RagA family outer membrane protein